MKKTILRMLVFVCCLTLAFPANAAVKDEADLLYENINSIGVGFDIDKTNGNAYCAGYVQAYYSVPVEVLVQLQVYKNNSWKTLMSWSSTGTRYASTDHYYSVDSGYNYKVKVTGYICNDLGIPIESEVIEKTIYYPAS